MKPIRKDTMLERKPASDVRTPPLHTQVRSFVLGYLAHSSPFETPPRFPTPVRVAVRQQAIAIPLQGCRFRQPESTASDRALVDGPVDCTGTGDIALATSIGGFPLIGDFLFKGCHPRLRRGQIHAAQPLRKPPGDSSVGPDAITTTPLAPEDQPPASPAVDNRIPPRSKSAFG